MTGTTDRHVRRQGREARTQLRARNRILDLLVLIPQDRARMEACHRTKGRFRASRQVRRVDRRRLEERLLAIMLDGALRIQSSSNSNDRMMMLHGTVK